MPHRKTSTLFMLGLSAAAVFIIIGLYFGSAAAQTPELSQSRSPQSELNNASHPQDTPSPTPTTPVDHSEFEILQQDFATPQDLTETCLSCHVDAAKEVMHTTHWTWEFVNETTGQTLGKKNVINDFCIATSSNEPRCTSCHVGYGWEDQSFDFNAQENVDCLVCHDTTGTYKKVPTGAGMPAEDVDLSLIAQNVGETSRETCGACHFYGGGGDEVKHGDLDSSLIAPDYELDVHMDAEGLDFTCATCHATDNHEIPGSRYSMDAEDWKGCEDCHTNPHTLSILNDHAEKIACQTCHIPEFARGDIPTKLTWDWSTAGKKDENGNLLIIKDEEGNITYHGLKGEFTWGENVIPEYLWFNGTVEYTLLGDTIDPQQSVKINNFIGDKNDPDSKIWPVKHFSGKQVYDSGYNTLVVPHLFGKDDTAYWGNFDWGKSVEAGMAYVNMPYSGEYGFVETDMYWPITHMVAPASEALHCQDCHTAEDSRLDFAALGYTDEEALRLSNFPPKTTEEMTKNETAPESCAECHKDEHSQWEESKHGEAGTGCVACHVLEGEEEHPVAPYSIDRSGELCGTCHIAEYEDWKTSAHGEKLIACSSCHNPHDQSMIISPDSQSVCENCHLLEAEEVIHSTHTAAEVYCEDCHVNTHDNSGHTFKVGSDTCLDCHSEDIHSSNSIISGTISEKIVIPPEDVEKTTEEMAQGQEAEAGVHSEPPTALVVIVSLILLAALAAIVFFQDTEEKA